MFLLKKKVFVAGTFDNFHTGHQFFLWSAREVGDLLVIIIARDKNVKRIKKKVPRNNELQRKLRVEQEFLDDDLVEVRLGNLNNNFLKTIAEEKPKILFLGFDQFFDEKECLKKFPKLEIKRAKEYFPMIFKSSKFFKILQK